MTGYAILKDQKFLPALGPQPDKARPNRLEARRSDRFLRNVRINVTALYAAAEVLGRFLPKEDTAALARQQQQILQVLDRIQPVATGVFDPKQRTLIQSFLAALSAQRDILHSAATTHLNVTMGFNSLDGD